MYITCCFRKFSSRPPFDTMLKFYRSPMPLDAFLSPDGSADLAEPEDGKRKASQHLGQKWKKGFQQRCKALGHVPRLDFSFYSFLVSL